MSHLKPPYDGQHDPLGDLIGIVGTIAIIAFVLFIAYLNRPDPEKYNTVTTPPAKIEGRSK